MTVAGPIEVDLFVSTSGTDSDWVVKLIDVYPDDYPDPKENPKGVRMGGYQQLVRGDVMRGKFRNSLERPEPFEPNRPTRVRFTMPDTYHCFRSRPPDHGPGAKHVVSAGRPKSAEVHRHLSRRRGGLSEGDATRVSLDDDALEDQRASAAIVLCPRLNLG